MKEYRDDSLDPYVEPVELRIANARCDSELRNLGISPHDRIKPSWNAVKMVRRGMLTDKQIRKYQAAGFYSSEYKEARKRVMASKHGKQGNWTEVNGRMIYTP